MIKKELLANIIEITLSFILLVCMTIPLSLLMYVSMNDYIFYELDGLVKNASDEGLIPVEIYAEVENTWGLSVDFLNSIDYFFLGAFLTMVSILFFSSYFCKRAGIFKVLSLITWVLIFVLFLTGIFFLMGNWINDLIMSMITGLNLYMPFFSYYLENGVFVHFIIILICVILNYVDFGLFKEQNRKNKESTVLNDEI